MFTGSSFIRKWRIRRSARRFCGIFLFEICGCLGDWTPAAAIEEQIERIRETLGEDGRAICGLSGGVDSSVAAALVHRAVGDRQTCFFIDNGLLREGEFETTLASAEQETKLNIVGVDASREFLSALHGVTDPETKRKRIGAAFIEVFEREATREHFRRRVAFWCRELSTRT